MLMIQQPRLERLLGERAAELGVRVRWGRQLTALTRLGHFRTDTAAGVFDDPAFAGLEPGWNRTPGGRLLLTRPGS